VEVIGLDAAQVGLAFTAGVLGFISPCSLPMLPSYVAYYLNRDVETSSEHRLFKALVFASATIAGFLTVFTAVGLLPSLAIQLVPLSEAVLIPLIGLGLLFVGILTAVSNIFNKVPYLGIAPPVVSGPSSFYVYGVAYALASLSCSLPVFLLVVLQSASSGGPLDTLLLFIVYGLGAGTLMVPITVATSLSKDYLYRRLITIMPHMRKLNVAILIVAGAYMIFTSLL